MKTEAIDACIRQVELDLYAGCPAATNARAELARLQDDSAKLEKVRQLVAQWLEVAERHHPEGVPRQAVPQHHEMGIVLNQTAASCWRGCADQIRAILGEQEQS